MKFGLAFECDKYMHGVNKYQDIDRFLEKQSISLTSARRSFAAFQVLLYSDSSFTLTVSGNPAFSPLNYADNIRVLVKMDRFSPENIKLCLVGYVEDDDRIRKSDILLNDPEMDVDPFMIQPVWVEISVPGDVSPGIYKGEVIVYNHSKFNDERIVHTMDFMVHVFNYLMPEAHDYKMYLDLWQHPANIARKHEVELWSNDHFCVLESYIASLARLGQKCISVIASEIPWLGQFCHRISNYPSNLYEYNMIRVFKNKDGYYEYDYSVMKRYIQLCFKYGINHEIELFGLLNIWTAASEGFDNILPDYPESVRIRYFDKNDGVFKYFTRAGEVIDYIKELEKFLVKEGWINLVRICADEPAQIDIFNQSLNIIRTHAPLFKYKAAINNMSFLNGVGIADDYAFLLDGIVDAWNDFENARNTITGNTCFYICCKPRSPNTFIGSDLVESQLLCIIAALFKFSGFLRWSYTAWPEKPREKICYQYPEYPAGDLFLVYPGYHGKPLLSLRYMNLLRGIEFFEMLSDESRGDKALYSARKSIRDLLFAESHGNGDQIDIEIIKVRSYSHASQDYLEAYRSILGILSASS